MKKTVNKIIFGVLATIMGTGGIVGIDALSARPIESTPEINIVETVGREAVSLKQGEGPMQGYAYVFEGEGIDRKQRKRIVRYSYKSERQASKEKDEILEERTNISQVFATGKEGEFVMRTYSSPVFAFGGDGKWYDLDYSTTTVENFLEKTDPEIRRKSTLLGTPFAHADVTDDSAAAALGQLRNQQGATSTSWTTVINAASSNGAFWGNALGYSYTQYADVAEDLYNAQRMLIPFNTSPLPSNASTTALSIQMYVSTRYASVDSYDYMAVATSSNNISPDSYDVSSYSLCDNNQSKVSVDYDIVNDMSSGAYNEFVIDYEGQTHLDVNNYTFYCIKNGHDWDTQAPVFATVSGMEVHTGSSLNPPYLEITYTTPNEEPVAGRQITPLAKIDNAHIFGAGNDGLTWRPAHLAIDGADLVNGDPYLILYNLSMGSQTSSAVGLTRLVHGSDVLRYAAGEGSSSGFFSIRNYSFFGVATTTGTGNAADDLELEFNCNDGTNGCAIDGKSLIAISLADLTQGKDYWYEQSTATTTTNSTSVCSDFVGPLSVDTVSGNEYIVIASGSGFFASGSGGTDGVYMEMSGDLTNTTDTNGQHEWEDDAEVIPYGYAELVSGDGTTKTVGVCGRKSQGATNNGEFNFGSIFVARANAFSQATTSSITGNWATTTLDYDTSLINDFADVLSIDYTPKSTERVVVIGNGRFTQNTGVRSAIVRLQNASTTGAFADVLGWEADDTAHSIWSPLLFGTEILFKDDGYNQYKIQMSGEATSPSTSNRDARLLVWSMKLHRVRTGIETQQE